MLTILYPLPSFYVPLLIIFSVSSYILTFSLSIVYPPSPPLGYLPFLTFLLVYKFHR